MWSKVGKSLRLVPLATILTIALLVPISSHAQEPDGTSIVSSDDQIAMIKDLAGLEDEELTFAFYLHNTGNSRAMNITLIASSLTMKEGAGAFTWAPSVIDRNSLAVNANASQLELGEVLLVNYTIREEARHKIGFNEATYVGTIKIVGDNFEEQTIGTEVTFRYNPLGTFSSR